MDDSDVPREPFLQADEVDEVGPVATGPGGQRDTAIGITKKPALDPLPPQDGQQPEPMTAISVTAVPPPLRPILKRERSAPPPPQYVPSTDITNGLNADQPNPADSLSLAQLRKLVTDMPTKIEPVPYDFQYRDTASMTEEIEELFGYDLEEAELHREALVHFTTTWEAFKRYDNSTNLNGIGSDLGWVSATDAEHRAFLCKLKEALHGSKHDALVETLQVLVYIGLGCWYETAGRDIPSETDGASHTTEEHASKAFEKLSSASKNQLQQIRANVLLICEHIGVDVLYGILKDAFAEQQNGNTSSDAATKKEPHFEKRFNGVMRSILILMCLITDVARRQEIEHEDLYITSCVLKLEPNILKHLTSLIVEMRWVDAHILPPQKLLILYRNICLLQFGGTQEALKIKAVVDLPAQDPESGLTHQARITASPLDYHAFRNEIISKYPAYSPPPPVFPLEPGSSSILPPLSEHFDRAATTNTASSGAGPANINGNSTSILYQSVHIATPAPSPPPSPAGPGGKGIKKQNYQTNQMFPFLYPPLEENSNAIGGKGSTEVQDLLCGRKWHGSDIPTSILEAADLFSQRMRATRAMTQLWDERVRFLKYDRGYNTIMDMNAGLEKRDDKQSPHDITDETKSLSDDLRVRLDAVEDFYISALPQLHSLVVVLLKVVLHAVTMMATHTTETITNMQNELFSPETHSYARTNKPERNGGKVQDSNPMLISELDTIRTHEIMVKAVSGIFTLLLRWFKLSHVLKFEYLSQLLFDSDYPQLVLQLFTHQDTDKAIEIKNERGNLNFFQFCRDNSRYGESQPPESDAIPIITCENDAQPPPDRKHPQYDHASSQSNPGPLSQQTLNTLEPLTFLPSHNPRYSWRVLFSTLNHLRILQKLVKHKAHRQLLMVQHKFSVVLKKTLRIPAAELRLQCLKLLKGQVPYCPRKWRQGNMRVITAIYLHCRPRLRDDWLAGLDVDHELQDALPQEQALRALTFWYNLDRHPDAMAKGLADGEKAALEREQDFFVRELEKMEAIARAPGDEAVDDDSMMLQDGHRWDGQGQSHMETW